MPFASYMNERVQDFAIKTRRLVIPMTLSTTEPAGTPAFGTGRGFAILGATAVTGSAGAGSTLTGNLGIYPNNASSITNFPPSTYTGTLEAANAAAQAAQAAALATYIDLQGRSHTTIATELGGQTLAAGVYGDTPVTAGTFTLNGTLTLSGGANDVYVFKTASTLVTGASGTPVIILGNVKAENIYWVVGSSATLNSGNAGTFYGNVIASASITVTTGGGTVNGSLVALNAAVTLSNTTVINTQPLTGVTDITTSLMDNITFKTQNNSTAVDTVDLGNNLAAAVNTNGQFGILVAAAMLGYGVVKKILLVRAYTFAAGVFTPVTSITLAGAASSGVTASNNVAINLDLSVAIDGTAKNVTLEFEYLLAE